MIKKENHKDIFVKLYPAYKEIKRNLVNHVNPVY